MVSDAKCSPAQHAHPLHTHARTRTHRLSFASLEKPIGLCVSLVPEVTEAVSSWLSDLSIFSELLALHLVNIRGMGGCCLFFIYLFI